MKGWKERKGGRERGGEGFLLEIRLLKQFITRITPYKYLRRSIGAQRDLIK